MPPEPFTLTDNPLNIAAVIYGPEDDVDSLLASFAQKLRNDGRRLGGVVQRNWRNDCGSAKLMEVIDLRTERKIPICQNLGPNATSCKLDEAGLADAAQAIHDALTGDVELVIINKFGKREAQGRGLRAEIAEAIVAGVPLLTAVSEKTYAAWRSFTGDFGTTLLCDDATLHDWWQNIARRLDRRQPTQPAAKQA
jgi:nucleoside-triphosphatase THEP1